MPSAPWKMPPIIKIYEALGALGDGRVKVDDATHARVRSSDGTKTYAVETSGDLREVSSNDNASYWQGYLGYPAIAVMLARGFAEPPPEAVAALTGIPWKELNRAFRNDYAKTLSEVERRIAKSGGNPESVRAACDATLAALSKLKPSRGVRRRPPAQRRSSPARR
jgi:hypothetical protein